VKRLREGGRRAGSPEPWLELARKKNPGGGPPGILLDAYITKEKKDLGLTNAFLHSYKKRDEIRTTSSAGILASCDGPAVKKEFRSHSAKESSGRGSKFLKKPQKEGA